jgi:hypothetical protein
MTKDKKKIIIIKKRDVTEMKNYIGFKNVIFERLNNTK